MKGDFFICLQWSDKSKSYYWIKNLMDENMQIYYNETSKNCIKQFLASLNFCSFIWYLKCLFVCKNDKLSMQLTLILDNQQVWKLQLQLSSCRIIIKMLQNRSRESTINHILCRAALSPLYKISWCYWCLLIENEKVKPNSLSTKWKIKSSHWVAGNMIKMQNHSWHKALEHRLISKS